MECQQDHFLHSNFMGMYHTIMFIMRNKKYSSAETSAFIRSNILQLHDWLAANNVYGVHNAHCGTSVCVVFHINSCKDMTTKFCHHVMNRCLPEESVHILLCSGRLPPRRSLFPPLVKTALWCQAANKHVLLPIKNCGLIKLSSFLCSESKPPCAYELPRLRFLVDHIHIIQNIMQ